MDGIERLRVKRGSEPTTFAEIADHLCDYIDRHPAEHDALDRFARFLAAVRDIGHDHDADPVHGLVGAHSRPTPRA